MLVYYKFAGVLAEIIVGVAFAVAVTEALGRPQDAITPGKWVPRKATWKPQTKKPAATSKN